MISDRNYIRLLGELENDERSAASEFDIVLSILIAKMKVGCYFYLGGMH